MCKFLIINLSAAAILFSACGNSNQTATNSAVSTTDSTANAIAKPETSATMPPTEKGADDDYVPSETGTEKAKPDAGKANVQGKVLFDGKPAAGIEVKICEKFSQYIGGCSGESFTTKTDADGEYLLTKITPKDYESILVRVFDTKGFIFATSGFGISAAKYKIEADKTFFAPPTNLFKDDLKIENPKVKAKVDPKDLELKWTAYPNAAYYKIRLMGSDVNHDSPYFDEKVEGTSFKVEKPVATGKYKLTVTAFNADDVKLADNKDGDYEFEIRGGAADAAGK